LQVILLHQSHHIPQHKEMARTIHNKTSRKDQEIRNWSTMGKSSLLGSNN